MSKRPPYARIAITLPPDDLAAADALASTLDRSRSWVVAEAVRRFVATQGGAGDAVNLSAHAEVAFPGLSNSRLLQLRRDLALTPEQRILIAEETLRNAPSSQSPMGARFFDRYEDFLDWKIHRGRVP